MCSNPSRLRYQNADPHFDKFDHEDDISTQTAVVVHINLFVLFLVFHFCPFCPYLFIEGQ